MQIIKIMLKIFYIRSNDMTVFFLILSNNLSTLKMLEYLKDINIPFL